MPVDLILLLGRIALLAALYVFLVVLAILLRRELASRASGPSERAPADLLIMEPEETGYDVGERIPLLAVSPIGRSDDNAVVLEDTFISGQHAILRWNGRGWVLEDLGSTNGTQINGRRVKKTAAVRPGDIIQLGRVKVKLVPA
ncbi:MAG TPA: FHA domain-containing protein [Chloroflexota bacterium]|nr:FHA domain-containing protein [Chloroflexota bacterium]